MHVLVSRSRVMESEELVKNLLPGFTTQYWLMTLTMALGNFNFCVLRSISIWFGHSFTGMTENITFSWEGGGVEGGGASELWRQDDWEKWASLYCNQRWNNVSPVNPNASSSGSNRCSSHRFPDFRINEVIVYSSNVRVIIIFTLPAIVYKPINHVTSEQTQETRDVHAPGPAVAEYSEYVASARVLLVGRRNQDQNCRQGESGWVGRTGRWITGHPLSVCLSAAGSCRYALAIDTPLNVRYARII